MISNDRLCKTGGVAGDTVYDNIVNPNVATVPDSIILYLVILYCCWHLLVLISDSAHCLNDHITLICPEGSWNSFSGTGL